MQSCGGCGLLALKREYPLKPFTVENFPLIYGMEFILFVVHLITNKQTNYLFYNTWAIQNMREAFASAGLNSRYFFVVLS